jgi:hypothetical protein
MWQMAEARVCGNVVDQREEAVRKKCLCLLFHADKFGNNLTPKLVR